LAPGETVSKKQNVYVHELATGKSTLVTKGYDGSAADDSSAWNSWADISANGRYVVFPSFAKNLVVGDTNGKTDIFVYDRDDKTMSMASKAHDGGLPNNSSGEPSISGNGRYVVFSSTATNLVAGLTISGQQIYRHDRDTGTTILISYGTDGTGANQACFYPVISRDGRYVAFWSTASNLTAGIAAGNTITQVFLRDVLSGTTTLVSKNATGTAGDKNSGGYSISRSVRISPDGRYVLFGSKAQNLLADNTTISDLWNAFVYDQTEKNLDSINPTQSGAKPNSGCDAGDIAEEACAVTFDSSASNLVANDTNSSTDVFVSIKTADGWSIGPKSQLGGWRNDLAVSGSLAALIEGFSVSLYDLSGESPVKRSNVPLGYEPVRLALSASGNYVYTISGWDTPRFAVVDISNPSAPVVKGECAAEVSQDGSIAGYGNYVYHTVENNSQPDIQVIDVSDPTKPTVVKTLGIPAHGLTIGGGKLYAVGYETANKFWVYDVSTNPLPSSWVGEYSGSVASRQGASLYYDGGANRVYSAVYGQGFQIFDVSSPSSPNKLLNSDANFNNPRDVYAAGNTVYVVDGSAVKVADVSNPATPAYLGKVDISGAFRVKGSGGSAYVMAMGDMAIQRIALAGGQPVVSASSGSPNMASGLLSDGNRLYLGSGDFFWVMDATDPANPQILSKDSRWKNLYSFALVSNRLYGTVSGKFHILDVANPAAPAQISELALGGTAQHRALSGSLAFVAIDANDDWRSEALEIIDCATPASPAKVGETLTFPGQINGIAAGVNEAGAKLLCIGGTETTGGKVVKVYDVTTPASPVLRSTLTVAGEQQRLFLSDGTLIVSSNTGDVNDIEAFDLSDPAAPKRAGAIKTHLAANDVKILSGEGDDPIVLLAKPGGSVHTYGYSPGTGSFYPGPVCPSPYSTQVTVSPTPNRAGGYTVATSDSSYGSYIQEITKKPKACCLTTEVSPAQAAAEGCTAAPAKVDPVDCGGTVDVTATAKEPWIFKEWTGAATGTSPSAQATAIASCSMATANFWKPTLTLAAGNQNPWDGQPFRPLAGPFDYANGAANVPIIHITLTANEVDDWLATALTFLISGTGDEKEDVAEARLYLGSVGGTLLGRKTFNADDGNLTFNFTVNIPKSSTVSMILVYDFKPERAWPCNSYGAKIDMSRVIAIPVNYPPGQKLPAPPLGVTGGPSTVRRGDTVIDDGDRQYGEAEDPTKNKPLEKPLKTRIQWQHPQSIEYIEYEITGEAAGAFLGGVLGQKKTQKQPNAEGYAEEIMTLGTNKGQQKPYDVKVDHKNKGAVCTSTYGASHFTAWGLGVDLGTTSQYDNPANGERFGTFLANIEAENKFTLTIDMAPPNYAEVIEVLFDIGGRTIVGTLVEKNKKYEATYNMADFNKMEKLVVTVKMEKDGAQIEQKAEYDVKSLQLPSWVEAVGKICHPESFTKEFSGDDGGGYTLTFNYPTNFAWSDYVPGDVGLLGGLNNDIDVEFSASATYRVNETSTFGATIKGQPTILGKEFGLEGGLSGDFDPNFAFQRGTGTIRASFGFDLPEKGYSKTFLVYGVPVTAAVDLSGNVEIFVRGGAVLNRQLEFEEVTVAPGTTVTGNITISLAAVFGLAKIAATGSPTVTIEIELKYTSANGTTTTWQGEVAVPITVVGSIFWGLGSATLYETTLGPWMFPSAGATPAAFRPLGALSAPSAPRLISTSSLAADGTGKRMSVWIGDTQPNESSANPDVFFRYFNGSAWGEAAPIIGANSPNSEWETDPAVVFMGEQSGQKTALSCWTANKGDKSLAHLNDILASQDIACAVWNGAAWSAPVKIIEDAQADGVVSLAYDPTLNNAVAVWVHNADAGKNALNRTAWQLMYSVYDPTSNQGAGAFAPAQIVSGTNTNKSDQMPVAAADGGGNVVLVWARDDDGKFYTELDKVVNGTNVDAENLDSHIMWAKLGVEGWSAPTALATGGKATRLYPSLAPSPGGSFLAVWTEKEPGKKRSIKYAVYSGGGWGQPGAVVESEQFMEDPKAVVDVAGKATVIWRGYAKGGKGALFASTSPSVSSPVWSEPEQITHDDAVQWQPTAVLDQNNKVVTAWSGYNMATGQAQSGTGMSGGVNVADPNPGSASLTNTYSAQAIDANSDQVYESLQVSVGVNVVAAGSFKVQADLYAGDKLVAQAALTRVDLTTGAQTFVLVFPGGLISNRGLDGPYSLKNVVVMDIRDSAVQTAYAKAPTFTTAAYPASSFIPGPLTLNQKNYQGTLVRATITVRDAQANLSASAKDQLLVKVSSTRNAKGFAVILEETGVDTGVFAGTIGFSTKANDPTNRNILVADHDLLYVVYNDARSYKWTGTAVWLAGAGVGDLNSDGRIDLADAILAVQFMAGMKIDAEINPLGMMDDKGRITIKEVIYILQKIAGLR
jgi:hypothetical protein